MQEFCICTMFTAILYIYCTCRCELATKHASVCDFLDSATHYHIVVSNESEAILAIALQSLSKLIRSKSNKCNQFIIFSLCFYLFRYCELHNTSDPSSGLQLSVCQSKCSSLIMIGSECLYESDFQTLLEVSNYNEAIQEIAVWALNFDCYNPITYAVPGVPISNTSCDNISFIDGLLTTTSGGEYIYLQYTLSLT